MSFAQNVKMELFAMSRVGIRVPSRAFAMASDSKAMEEYENMSVRDCADLIVNLAQLG